MTCACKKNSATGQAAADITVVFASGKRRGYSSENAAKAIVASSPGAYIVPAPAPVTVG